MCVVSTFREMSLNYIIKDESGFYFWRRFFEKLNMCHA